MKLINILGTNAIGKSTRVTNLVRYLQSKFDEKIITFNTTKKGTKDVGRIYGDKYFILGDFNSKGVWVGLDLAHFTTTDSRLEFMKYINESYPSVELFIQEGYFNNGSKRFSMDELSLFGVTNYDFYFFIYNDITEFLERTNNRTGKHERGLEWAEKSQGWRDNRSFSKLYEHYVELGEPECTVQKFSKDASEYLFIEILFNDTFTKPITQDKIENNINASEW